MYLMNMQRMMSQIGRCCMPQSLHLAAGCQSAVEARSWADAVHASWKDTVQQRLRSCHSASSSGRSGSSTLHGRRSKHLYATAEQDTSAQIPGITAIRCTMRDVPGTDADLVAETLLGLGAQSASVTEFRPPGAEEQEIFSDGSPASRGVWDRCTVTAHFAPDQDVDGPVQVVKSAMGLDSIHTEVSDIADSDWLDGICASYQPTRIVDDLWIIPSWSDPVEADAMNVKLEPGLAFGTGEHPTTRLCLKMIYALGRSFFKGAHVMDYGTGSGVLALTALKLGASLAFGTDTDPVAIRAARQNSSLNTIEGTFITQQCAPSIEGPDPVQANPQGFVLPSQYDCVVANILQGPLMDLKPRLSGYVKPGGVLLLSGIMTTQVPSIQEAYQDEFENFRVYTDEVWSLVLAIRRVGPSCSLALDLDKLPNAL